MADTTINTSYLMFTSSTSNTNSMDISSLKTSGTASMSFESAMKNTVNTKTSDNTDNSKNISKSTDTSEVSDTSNEKITDTETVDNADSKTADTDEVNEDVKNETISDNDENVNLGDIQEELTDYAEQIVDIIKEFSGASDEDIQKAFEELGITSIDLLNVNNVVNVMQNLSQADNVSELMTNDLFSTSIKDVMNVIDEAKQSVLTDFGIDNSQFNAVIKDISNMENLADVTNFTSEEVTSGSDILTALNNINDNETVSSQTSDLVTENNTDTQDDEIKSQYNQNQAEADPGDTVSTEEESFEGIKITSGSSETASNNEFTENNNFLNTFAEKIMQVDGEVIETVDAQKIIEQIVNEIKTTVKSDTTSIEMQLYPENLGKVGIEVISKDGELTANITVKDYQVKEIIQTHLDVLKENLNNQGIKVEAVEISVASRGFDENQDQSQTEEENSSNTKKAFVDTSLFDDEGEILEQEEIQRELLLKGATVSYSA